MRPGLSLILSCWTCAALAAGPRAAGPRDDEAAAVLAASCAGCHRDTATEPGGIPDLRGLSAGDIAGKLEAYRRGDLQGTLMNRLARGYTEAEIRQLAAVLGAPPP